MITNTQLMELTTSEIEQVDWLLEHINEHVDWSNPFKQEEFTKLRTWVADATMQPVDYVTVDGNTDGGRLYTKLRVQAKEERAKEVYADIQLLRFSEYGYLNNARGTALAALAYAKTQHKDRQSFSGTGPTGATFYGSSPERVKRAMEGHDYYRKRVRVSLNKTSFR